MTSGTLRQWPRRSRMLAAGIVILSSMAVINCVTSPENKCVVAQSRVAQLSWQMRVAQVESGEIPSALPRADFDPWGMPYLLDRRQTSFRVYSSGPDRVPGSADDVDESHRPSECPVDAAFMCAASWP